MTKLKGLAYDEQQITYLAAQYVKHSREAIDILPNMDAPIAEGVMRAFLKAHQRRPGGLSMEIGTFEGATARMLLLALDDLYDGIPPFLVTCDPYGGKPYQGGQVIDGKSAIFDGKDLGYDERAYMRMKKALATWPNHAHYPVRSYEMLPNMAAFWPFPQSERIVTFVLLDGEHNAETIFNEARCCLALDPQACVIVDNADTDPRTVDTLKTEFTVTEVAYNKRVEEIAGTGKEGFWTDQLVRVEPK